MKSFLDLITDSPNVVTKEEFIEIWNKLQPRNRFYDLDSLEYGNGYYIHVIVFPASGERKLIGFHGDANDLKRFCPDALTQLDNICRLNPPAQCPLGANMHPQDFHDRITALSMIARSFLIMLPKEFVSTDPPGTTDPKAPGEYEEFAEIMDDVFEAAKELREKAEAFVDATDDYDDWLEAHSGDAEDQEPGETIQ